MRKPAAEVARIEEGFRLDWGGSLPELEIAYETWGHLNSARDNAVLICPAFSAHSHARSSAADSSPGWWENMIGPDAAFDTDRFFVICPSLLGSCYGTTGPTSIDPRTRNPYGPTFPVIAVRDMVNAHVALLDHLEISRLHAVAGGSLGGMEAIEFAVNHSSRAAKILTISGTDYTRPYTAAIRHIGRRAIMLDHDFQGGRYSGRPPRSGLRLARELGTMFYRSREEFNERFSVTPIATPSRDGITFDVQSYLDHQGQKIVEHFDANAYLTLSLAMDLHNVGRNAASLEAAFARVESDVLVVGVREDRLIPIDEQRSIDAWLRKAGKQVTWREVSSPIGHDAFLVEVDVMTPIIKDFV